MAVDIQDIGIVTGRRPESVTGGHQARGVVESDPFTDALESLRRIRTEHVVAYEHDVVAGMREQMLKRPRTSTSARSPRYAPTPDPPGPSQPPKSMGRRFAPNSKWPMSSM